MTVYPSFPHLSHQLLCLADAMAQLEADKAQANIKDDTSQGLKEKAKCDHMTPNKYV